MKSLLLIYPIVFLLIFLFTKNKKNHIIYIAYILLYFIASLGAYIYYDILFQGYNIYIEAILFHISMFALIIFPIRKFDNIRNLSIPHNCYKKILDILSVFIIFVSLITICTDVPKINISSFINNEILDLRQRLLDAPVGNIFVRYISIFSQSYWSVALVLAFYYIRFYPERKFQIILLLISSLSVVISGFVVAAREYVIKYIMIFGILLYNFYPYISKYWKVRLNISIFTVGAFFVLSFVLITFFRFVESTNEQYTMFESLFLYLSQGFVYFSETYKELFAGLGNGRFHFLLSFYGGVNVYNINDQFASVQVGLNAFSTTIGSWIIDVGAIWTVIIALIHCLLFNMVGNSKLSIFKLFYVVWIYEFLFSALFFYNEYFTGTRIITILLIVFLDLYTSKKIKIL